MTFLAWTHGWKYLMAAATAAEAAAASRFPSSAAAAGERRVEYEVRPKVKQAVKRRRVRHGLSLKEEKFPALSQYRVTEHLMD